MESFCVDSVVPFAGVNFTATYIGQEIALKLARASGGSERKRQGWLLRRRRIDSGAHRYQADEVWTGGGDRRYA